MYAVSCSLSMSTRAVIQSQGYFWHRKLVNSDPIMKSCASAFIVQNKSQEDIGYQNWAKSWRLIYLASSLRIHYHHCAISISPREWLVQKHLSPLKGFPQLSLQPHSIDYVCTTKLWCGWAWQMTRTLQIGDGTRKAASWLQRTLSQQRRTLLLTNFSKLFIVTV